MVGNRIHRIARNIVVTILVVIALFATRNASAAQLTLDWVDKTGGTASFTIERKTDITSTYARIATTPAGTTTYVDTAVVAGTTYCYRVKVTNSSADSDYSNEACGSAAGFDVNLAKAGTGSGSVISTRSGINCGGTCIAAYGPGSVVTLTAARASGSFFSGWSGGCAGADPSGMAGNAPVTVTATFSLDGAAPTASNTSPASGNSGSVGAALNAADNDTATRGTSGSAMTCRSPAKSAIVSARTPLSSAPAKTNSLRKQTHGELERSFHGADGALASRSAEGRAH